MASQINPVIAAFIQARNQASEDFNKQRQFEMMQQRLMFEKEHQDAETELHKQQLAQRAVEAQDEVKRYDATAKIGQQRNMVNAMNMYRGLIAGGAKPEIASGMLGNFGFEPDDINAIVESARDLPEVLAAKNQGKIDMLIKELPMRTEDAIKRAVGLVEPKKDLMESTFNFRTQEIEQRAKADYDRAIAVAREHSRGLLEAVDRRIAAGMYGDKKKLSDAEEKKYIDLDVSEQLFKNIKATLDDKKKSQYFIGPIGAKLRNIKRSTIGLDETESQVESMLGRVLATIGHPLFGASFTKGEKEILLSFVPGPEGNLTPAAAKAKIEEGLKYIQTQRNAMNAVYGIKEKATSSTSERPDLDSIRKRFNIGGKK